MKDRYSYVIHFKSEAHLLSLPNSFVWLLAGFSYFEVVGMKLFPVACQASFVKGQLTTWTGGTLQTGGMREHKRVFLQANLEGTFYRFVHNKFIRRESQRRAGSSNHILREVIVEKHVSRGGVTEGYLQGCLR